jgi:hypothetical protein
MTAKWILAGRDLELLERAGGRFGDDGRVWTPSERSWQAAATDPSRWPAPDSGLPALHDPSLRARLEILEVAAAVTIGIAWGFATAIAGHIAARMQGKWT